MSVRRLAKDQPESFAFNKKSEDEIKFWLAKYPEEKKASAVIPHAVDRAEAGRLGL